MKQIKLDYVTNEKFNKEITISENFITRAYQVFNGKMLENGDKIEDILKVMLNKNRALEQLENGITYNNKKYLPLITSPGMQKKEEKIDGEELKLEFLFISEKIIEFKYILEKLISGNKIAEFKEEEKEMCLVKDISARVGLATTGTEKINYNPNIVIVDEATYQYSFTYSYLENEQIKRQEEPKSMDFILSDGGGLMSPKMANIIKESLGIDYNVDFAIIRHYKGFAVKGVVLRFNFVNYFKEHYKEDFEKGKFGFRYNYNTLVYEIKDIFGNWHNVENIDLLLNKSMTKWVKNWTSLEELEQEYSKDFYKKYDDILNCLYVSKINKDPKKLKTHSRVNYQLLQNTCATGEDLIEMAKTDINYYKRLLEFKDLDAIRLFLGDLVAKDEEESTISDRLNFVLKKQGDKALKLRWVKRQIGRLINKKIRELAGGKFNLKGNYKLMALDPVSYCNYLLNGNTGNNGLDAEEFYIPGQTGKRVMYRNPIACYWEVRKIELTNKLDRWLKDYTSEITFVNGKDNTLQLLSGADLDGDGVGVIENNILYDCIMKEKYPFINISESEQAEPHIFNDTNLYKDIITSSGNMIGRIAISNSKLNMLCTSLDNIVVDKEIYTYKEYLDFKANKIGLKADELTEEQLEKIKNEIKDTKKLKDLDNRIKRLMIYKSMKVHKETFAYILLASQLAIDMPKTLKPVPEEITDKFKFLSFVKKPVFMHYLGKCSCKGKGKVADCKDLIRWGKDGNIKKANNSMDVLCNYVVKELLIDNIESQKGQDSASSVIKFMELEEDKNTPISSDLVQIWTNYKDIRKVHRKNEKADLNDYETLKAIKELELDDSTIVSTLKNCKASTRFILMFFFNTYKNRIEKKGIIDSYSYKKDDENGDIDWMYHTYKKIENVSFKEKDIQKDLNENIKKRAGVIKIRCGGVKTAIDKGLELTIGLGCFVNRKGIEQEQIQLKREDKMIGYIFNNFVELIDNEKTYRVVTAEIDAKNNTVYNLELEIA